ncbi:hypothetical protein JB92DRAFT_3082021 [Gautieria morchelliformis]|nr:hypothetical protein JB92DRAFT_3082021 [Gautieria morchelliformis]
MPVKDLVQQFEGSSSSSGDPRMPSRARRHSASPVPFMPPGQRTAPSSSPARFIQHPLLKRPSVPLHNARDSLPLATLSRHAIVAPKSSLSDGRPNTPKQCKSVAELDTTSLNARRGLETRTASVRSAELRGTSIHSGTHQPRYTLVSQSHPIHHVPVAAKTVFSRGSAPLSLPALDDYLSSFPAPTFPIVPPHRSTSSPGKQPKGNLFPPMDLLVASGHTIEELEKNSAAQSWRNRGNIFNTLSFIAISVLGSSALSKYYSLQGLYDGLQLIALLLNTVVPSTGSNTADKWRQVFLGTIPNVLALNLGNTLVGSVILLIVFMTLSGLLLYYFHVSTKSIALASSREGLQGKDTGAGWGIIFTSFVLTVFYLPLSTLAVHALLWSQDFWVLGPPSQFRDPLDFCYTTTMSKNEINFAPMVVILAALTFICLTVWFPIRLAMVIRGAVPHVDKYTELGMRRSRVELNHEYERLLERDTSSFSFLYRDLRMGWGTYRAFHLLVKFTTLLIVGVLDSDNCLFRNANRNTVSVVRQAILLFAMSSYLVAQSVLSPFLDPVWNASEWVSAACYVAFAALGLAATLNLPIGVLDQSCFHSIYGLSYGFTFYFLIINVSWARRFVKKLSRRIDFSIDIFSPHLDISNKSHHTRRRIWQESITVILLGSHECAIPKSQKMEFSESQDCQWPPYLLEFQGTPAERHVENLKILREMGGLEYAKGVALHHGRHSERMNHVLAKIQRHFIGPDSYWRTPSRCETHSSCFGNAWWIPFPPTLVMRYDSGDLVVLNKVHHLEEYVNQNEDLVVQEKRSIRVALRALDGLVVTWPHTHTQPVGARHSWCWGHRYTAQASMKYHSCVFSIRRRGSLLWKGVQLGSGFDVQLTYTRDVQVDGTAIGVDDDFDLTPQLARFLTLNRELIHDRLHQINSVIRDYRRQTRRNVRAKRDTLTYEFLSTIYCNPEDSHDLTKALVEQEKDPRVRQVFAEHEVALRVTNERMLAVSRSEASTFWYLFWDDLWRRNHDTIAALKTHASDFNPHCSTSIAYRPIPRAALESFLSQRGLFARKGRRDFIHSGILNKLYFRLNQIVFRGSEKAIAYHLGDDSIEVDLENLEFSSHAKSSTLGTGGGTDHDDVSIRARPLYRWEAIFEDPLRPSAEGRYRRWLPKLAVWFGLTPFWKPSMAFTSGVSLDVRLEDGRYVLLDNAVDELKEK